MCVCLPIYTRHIDHNINHVTAQLIRLHVHWRAAHTHTQITTITTNVSCDSSPVCGNIDLTDHVKQKRLLYTRILQGVVLNGRPPYTHTHTHTHTHTLTEMSMLSKFSRVGNCGISFCTTRLKACSEHPLLTHTHTHTHTHLKNGVVVYGCKVEAEMYTIESSVSQVISGSLVNVSLSLNLTIVGQTINFVNEHLKLNGRVDLVGPRDCLVKPYQCWSVVVLATREHADSACHYHCR